ncbi:type II toxin-antitoxin system HicB family antitoxin [Allorhizobium pseudoryzae]|uniref:type II toxin-antitoxin system HicB family antitoxin n=1 Tax=Allorhizobium pseudoryzae TaxID=379684 RepID=UPI0013EAC296|nr:type II toxin-antitoxin system HicB family antitoxin [Allorhizobium pseudoryzae]
MQTTYGILHHENQSFGVSFPDFPGCVTGGATEEEALRKADEVLTFHVAGMVEDGEALPISRTLEDLRLDPDVQEALVDGTIFVARYDVPRKAVRINISMDEGLVEAVDRAAGRINQSRSAFLADAARRRLEELVFDKTG